MDLTDKGLFLIYIKKSGQLCSALPDIITVKEQRIFDSHENNINLRTHTICDFAVRMSSFYTPPGNAVRIYSPKRDTAVGMPSPKCRMRSFVFYFGVVAILTLTR